MHNCHYYVVEAISGADACEHVESTLADWGNEDNWRVMCGAVSEYNEVYSTGNGRYCPEDGCSGPALTIEAMNAEIVESLKPELSPSVAAKLAEIAAGKVIFEDGYELLAVQDYIENLYALNSTNHGSYHMLYDSWKGYHYDKFGVSVGHGRSKPQNSLDFIKKTDQSFDPESERLWVVIIDMHS